MTRRLLAGAAVLFLCGAAQAAQPADPAAEPAPRARLTATLEALLAAVRDRDADRLAALVAPGAIMSDREGAGHRALPLTAERMGRFAAECRRVGERGVVPTSPPTQILTYDCNGHSGYELYAAFDPGGGRIREIRMDGPGPTAEYWAWLRRARAEEAAQRVVLRQKVPETLDRLFDAVRGGDEAAFQALIEPRESQNVLHDWRDGRYRSGPLTLARMRPIVARCTRSDRPYDDPYMHPWHHITEYLCNGRRFYTLIGSFSMDGSRIIRIVMNGSDVTRPERVTARQRELERQWAREREADARLHRQLMQVADAFLDAARAGDEAGFRAFVATGAPEPGPSFYDSRTLPETGERRPLTIEAVRPFALACRREAHPPQFEPSWPGRSQGARFACGGEPNHYFEIAFEPDGRRIRHVIIQGPNRRIPVH